MSDSRSAREYPDYPNSENQDSVSIAKNFSLHKKNKMPLFKSRLTNPNPIIQEKARYFADCFDFILSQLGSFDFPDLENHRSLLEKIRFLLLNFLPTSRKYIEHYSLNKMLAPTDRILKKHYPKAIKIGKLIRAGKYSDSSERQSLLIDLDLIIYDMKVNLLEYAVEDLQTVLHCPEHLESHEHIQIIEQATTMIVSELIFKGHPKKDLGTLIENLLSNEVKLIQNQVYTKFPLPLTINQNSGKLSSNLQQEITNFMENRTLRQQFDGITNFYQTTHENKILFKILNTKSKKRIDKSYDNVRLTNQIQPYLTTDINKTYRAFFSVPDQLFIEVSLPVVSANSASQLAREMIGRTIAKFDDFFNIRLLIDYSAMVYRIEGIYSIRFTFDTDWIRENRPIKTRLENKMLKLNNQASNRFLHLEHIYAEAKTGILADLKLSNYWRYFESCFSGLGMNAEQIKNSAALILSNYRITHLWFPYCQLASEVLWENRDHISEPHVQLSYRELVDFLDLNQLNINWVLQANTYTRHPFLTKRFNRFSKKPIAKVKQELYAYYQGILLEAYEQRNSIQHSGQFQQMALDKLLMSFPELVSDLRELFQSQILKGKLITYQEIIAELEIPPTILQRKINKNALITELS